MTWTRVQPDMWDAGKSKTYELPGHTVTVTNVTADTDFKGKTGVMLGFNQVEQGSHSDWKTWKNGKAFSSQGKVREF